MEKYELLTIWPGGEHVHLVTEDKNVLAAKYNYGRETEMSLRVRTDGRILTIREADELCGEKWQIVPQVVKRKNKECSEKKETNIKRKPVAEIDEDGTILRIFPSVEKMAEEIGICWSMAGVWARSGRIRTTGCKYIYLEEMKSESNA